MTVQSERKYCSSVLMANMGFDAREGHTIPFEVNNSGFLGQVNDHQGIFPDSTSCRFCRIGCKACKCFQVAGVLDFEKGVFLVRYSSFWLEDELMRYGSICRAFPKDFSKYADSAKIS